jgi:hypothetical protein
MTSSILYLLQSLCLVIEAKLVVQAYTTDLHRCFDSVIGVNCLLALGHTAPRARNYTRTKPLHTVPRARNYTRTKPLHTAPRARNYTRTMPLHSTPRARNSTRTRHHNNTTPRARNSTALSTIYAELSDSV